MAIAIMGAGCLKCADKGFERITDGTVSTIVCIGDASRPHPSVLAYGACSSHDAVTGSSQANPVKKNIVRGFEGARRVSPGATPTPDL